MQPKSINALMSYMRDKKGIQISGSLQKRKLRYIGYFHGYKGYRYCNSPKALLPYTSFNELLSVYNFDMQVKAILYPQIMFLETTIKNYALEEILNQSKSERFADVYNFLLNDYKSYQVGTQGYKTAISKRMAVRNKVYGNISRDYGKNNIIVHYYDKDKPVPIWAIFEIISLGEFGNLFACLNTYTRQAISSSIGINKAVDNDGRMTEKIVFCLKDLRNAIAHNNTIFDTRFKTGSINNRIASYISSETGIKNINFNSILDYIILVSFMLKILKRNKSDILSFIQQFENAYETLRKNVPTNIYSRIIFTDTKNKLNTLKNFL
ncbi:MAG: Abi family protein [Ruminococcus sp.]|nr:Abi family protein [Ruminococcus sp.]